MEVLDRNTLDRYGLSWVHPVKQFDIRDVVHGSLWTETCRSAGAINTLQNGVSRYGGTYRESSHSSGPDIPQKPL